MASLYIMAIGGTGAKCVEAIVHAIAARLFTPQSLKDSKIKIFFIDPDKANGNIARAQRAIETYQRRDEVWQGLWPRMPLADPKTWSSFGAGNQTLADFFAQAKYQETSLGNLLNVLYTEGERTENLDVGFRGRPAIGSAIMSQVNRDPFWQEFINEVAQDLKNGTPKIFLCGSIFGGTGAAGFPTFGRLIQEQLPQVTLGGLLMLPYFCFSVPPSQGQRELHARSEDFLLKTEAALRYYQAQDSFNIIYLLGDSESVEVPHFSIGQADQENPPHFLELYGALAARHFWLSETPENPKGRLALMARNKPGEIGWDDLPKPERNLISNDLDVQKALITTTRFAFAWTAGIVLDLKKVEPRQGGLTWFQRFFRRRTPWGWNHLPPPESEILQVIDRWCESYLTWLALIHYNEPSRDCVKLFQVDKFAHRDGKLRKNIDGFADLVWDKELSTYQELMKELKNQVGSPPQTSAIALAQALYQLCQSS